MQKYIVLHLSPASKMILSKQFYEDKYDGHKVKITQKEDGREWEFPVKQYGFSKQETIYVVGE